MTKHTRLFGRAVALATIVAVGTPLLAPAEAMAAPRKPGVTTHHDITDFSAARRQHHVRRGGNGGAAAAAAFAGIVGTIGSIAAAQAARDAYEDRYYYGGPGYYGGPHYYGGPGYMGPGYGYYGRGW